MQACPRSLLLKQTTLLLEVSRGGCKCVFAWVQEHGGSKSSTGIAEEQAQDLVRSLQTASLLGKLRSAVQNMDEQLAATMVSI